MSHLVLPVALPPGWRRLETSPRPAEWAAPSITTGFEARNRTILSRSALPAINMDFSANLGKLVLRLMLGGLLLLHGLAKIQRGVDGIMQRVGSSGLPSSLGYLVYVGEVLAPLLLIVGLWSRAAALIVAVNIVVAVLLAHASQFGELGRSGGWALELQAFYFFTAVAIMLVGGGRFGVGGGKGALS